MCRQGKPLILIWEMLVTKCCVFLLDLGCKLPKNYTNMVQPWKVYEAIQVESLSWMSPNQSNSDCHCSFSERHGSAACRLEVLLCKARERTSFLECLLLALVSSPFLHTHLRFLLPRAFVSNYVCVAPLLEKWHVQ
jgi:hypothetical protein